MQLQSSFVHSDWLCCPSCKSSGSKVRSLRRCDAARGSYRCGMSLVSWDRWLSGDQGWKGGRKLKKPEQGLARQAGVVPHLPHQDPTEECKCIHPGRHPIEDERPHRSAPPSLPRRSIRSHPSIRQILNNIRPKNILTELLLLHKIQRLESGARVSIKARCVVSLTMALPSFSAWNSGKEREDATRTRERGGTRAGRSI
jgi:hypothetical protein